MPEMKPCKIQIEIGRLNKQCANPMPKTEFTMPKLEKSWNIGKVSTTGGVIRKEMKARRVVRRRVKKGRRSN